MCNNYKSVLVISISKVNLETDITNTILGHCYYTYYIGTNLFIVDLGLYWSASFSDIKEIDIIYGI